jgi:hypothetical protein
VEHRRLAERPDRPTQPGLSAVLARFCLRLTILTVFAAFGSIGFARSLAALLWMSIVLCVVVAIMRRETLFRDTLNHWDETIAYAALYALLCRLSQSAPV